MPSPEQVSWVGAATGGLPRFSRRPGGVPGRCPWNGRAS